VVQYVALPLQLMAGGGAIMVPYWFPLTVNVA
jgi:hypothetical protein